MQYKTEIMYVLEGKIINNESILNNLNIVKNSNKPNDNYDNVMVTVITNSGR
jgi:hypothetical protein